MKWEKIKLENIVSFRTGKLNSNAAIPNGIYPFYTCSKEIYKTNTASFNTEAVLLGGNNAVGDYPLFYVNGEFDAYQRTYIIEPLDSNALNIRFLYYNLRPRLKDFQNYSTGASTKFLTLKILNAVEVQFPPLPTQRKIASILSGYDDLIENNLKRIKLLEEAINLNFKDLISKEDKNFTYIKLNSFVDIISGFPFKSNYYNENGKHKIVTIKNVQDGFFVPIVTDRIDDVPDNMNKALFLTTGDVIMSLTGNVGRVCLVYGDDYVLNQRVVKLSAKEQIDQPFIYALVRDKQMLKILENLSNGAAQQNLSPIKMGELPIRYPNKSLREDFNQKVSPMLEMICKLNIQNTKLREARDILLPKLMNGQIEV